MHGLARAGQMFAEGRNVDVDAATGSYGDCHALLSLKCPDRQGAPDPEPGDRNRNRRLRTGGITGMNAAEMMTSDDLVERSVEFWNEALTRNSLLAHLDRLLHERAWALDDGSRLAIDPIASDVASYQVMYRVLCAGRPGPTVEVGFGMGVSALMFAAYQADAGFEHIAIDPYGLPDNATGKAERALARLAQGRVKVMREPSEYALPRLAMTGRIANLAFSLVDGSHLFDHALIDFFYLDRMTEAGGVLAVDDAASPAVATLLSFIEANRAYQIRWLGANTALCLKLADDRRDWDHFRPFTVDTRRDWGQ
jgi:hypothetical protein